MLDCVASGCEGYGPHHVLIASAAVIGWIWDIGLQGWSRAGVPELHILAGPVQQF